jgi:uncharacterized membrane protein
MTALEVIATIFAILILVKVSVVLISLQLWMKNVSQPLLGNPPLARAVYTVLAAVVGYYVFTSLYVADVLAVMGFTALLMGLALLPYAKTLLKTAEEMSADRSKLLQNAWLPLVVWVVIALWVLASVFA